MGNGRKWGYGKLKKSVGARSMTEMKHAEKLIERILFWRHAGRR